MLGSPLGYIYIGHSDDEDSGFDWHAYVAEWWWSPTKLNDEWMVHGSDMFNFWLKKCNPRKKEIQYNY